MKKWILAILILIVVAIGLLYVIVPKTVRIQQSILVPVTTRGFSRIILDDKKWAQWWPGEVLPADGKGHGNFSFNNNTYSIVEKKLSSITLLIGMRKDSFLTELFFIPTNADTIGLNWQGLHNAPSMPLARLEFYYQAKALSKDLQTILEKMKSFYTNQANVYGLSIQNTKVVDSALISISLTTNGYPSIKDIYKLVEQLQAFAQRNNAKQTGAPMLNINTIDSINYTTRVALPVDKILKDEGPIHYRWMMGGGRILIAEVKGGPSTINKAFNEMQNYIDDNRFAAAAIPFQSLITDRSKEPDTSKWTTKLYWPVM